MTRVLAINFYRILRTAEPSLYLVAGLCLLFFGYVEVKAHAALQSAEIIGRSVPEHGTVGASITRHPLAGGTDAEVIGRLDIPKLKLSVPILSDYDPDSLRRGVGHIKGSANIGGLGNLGLAGHRDTFLRPLRNISSKTPISITVADGTYEYIVDRTEVVDPDRVDVLDIGDRPELTLITCYPFDFIGAAPKRFIVHAHLTSVFPATK